MQKKFYQRSSLIASVVLTAALTGCATPPPQSPENICDIFEEHNDWYHAAADARERWGVPIHVPMAMMYQESSFKHDAVPPRYYFLGFIPWGRVSSAYGYSQAKDMTWEDYQRETGNGWASRSDFEDAVDFMGWFIYKSYEINGVSKWDAYAQYLNYHEGWGGYARKTYLSKPWLVKVSKQVKSRSLRYATQLKTCEDDLKHGWLYNLFFDW
ncbi:MULTISPECIES: hypothetical protein [Idiomarina]|jgi:hypothetical protein|uniref:Transglycosylase SLT domain-containing protein n=2 Tax=Idiomarina baltica TaxID=190892 RepID=A0A348WQA3_9GAMM|nr:MULTISPECIES: hypothetical protein [Idiomarina]MBR36987.1 hypothetical protein [Idiomarina sp.]EAQ31683.1 Uncharacterized conserved secreted protein [Idiomarina baltica OS145]KXS35463.1 MAG: hypothetical protein AWU56_1155 [Idiomarina sp. T82-3]HAE89497.1 hypothetical protein [Idiomarina sp.]HAR56715.1 hypothetical protein [Idiomarina baltica]|tara:strand:- start:2110 stop:2745 length:636 start_codon:yes stop_codon:yes gene_type:complete